MAWTFRAAESKRIGAKKKLRTTKALLYGGCTTLSECLLTGGGLLCFSRWDVQQVFIDAMKIAGFSVKSVLVWDRMAHGMGDLKSAFAPQYDTCIFAIKGPYVFPNSRPADVIQCQRLSGMKMTHPNEKPVELMQRLIEMTTKPNDLILDPFAGSGTTLVAALQSGRRYMGIEISPQHFETAQKRLYEAAFNIGG